MLDQFKGAFGGAVGAGFVLILLPCLALVGWMPSLAATPTVGLPILAVFGIMILFGSLALIASLFAGLQMHDPHQPLGLPDGSVRAAIALSLIVLFAIISIMLYQSVSKPYVITKVSAAAKETMVKDLANRIVAIVPECPSGEEDCTDAPSYSVHVLQPQGQESTDLAKQLLILIGTLMTSVTSFYFASRGNEAFRREDEEEVEEPQPPPVGDGNVPPTNGALPDAEAHVDGCDVPIGEPTADEDLPAATGGVETR